jgi:MFS family permease
MDTPEQSNSKAPLLSPVLRLFLVTMILANVAGAMYSGFLPLYLKSLGADVAQIGLFFTIAQIIPLILQILGGWISDSLGRLKSIAAGSVSGVVSYIALILAPTWGWVFLGEGLNAITRSLVGPSFGAFIAEESQESNRAKVYGLVDTFYTIVSIVGPPFGGYLIDRYGFKVMLIVAASIYTIATVMRVLMANRANHPGQEEGESQPAAGSPEGESFRDFWAGGCRRCDDLDCDHRRDQGYIFLAFRQPDSSLFGRHCQDERSKDWLAQLNFGDRNDADIVSCWSPGGQARRTPGDRTGVCYAIDCFIYLY